MSALENDPKKFSDFLKVLFVTIDFNDYNLTILESLNLSSSILSFIVRFDKSDTDILNIYMKFLERGCTNKSFYKFIGFLQTNIETFDFAFIEKLLTLSLVHQPKLSRGWWLTDILDDQQITLNIKQKDLLKTGLSVIFDFSVDEETVSSDLDFPIIWVSSDLFPEDGLLVSISLSLHTFNLYLIHKKQPVKSHQVLVREFPHQTFFAGISIEVIDKSCSVTIACRESPYSTKRFELPTSNFFPENSTMSFGYFNLGVNSGKPFKPDCFCFKRFVGRLGQIDVLSYLRNLPVFPKNTSLFGDVHQNVYLEHPKKYIFSIVPRNESVGITQNASRSVSFTVNGVHAYETPHFTATLEHNGGGLLWLFFAQSIFDKLSNKTIEPTQVVISILEAMYLASMSIIKAYLCLERTCYSNSEIFFDVFHYFLYLHNISAVVPTSKIIDGLFDNIGLTVKVSRGSKEINWQPFLDLLTCPIVWSDFSFDIQALRMQSICDYLAYCQENASLRQLPLDRMLCYLHRVASSTLPCLKKSQLFEPLFKIFTHILLTAKSFEPLKLFCEYFLANEDPNIDAMAVSVLTKLFKTKTEKHGSRLTLFTKVPFVVLIEKFMARNNVHVMQALCDFTICLIDNNMLTTIIPLNIFRCWFFKLLTHLHCCESSVYKLSDAIIKRLSKIKIDSSAVADQVIQVFVWSLLLFYRLPIKSRLLLFKKLIKICEKSPNFISRMVNLDYFEILMTVPIWRSIPCVVFSHLNSENSILCVKNEGVGHTHHCSYDFECSKIESRISANTIIEKIASVHLSFYLDHFKPFEFLMSPILTCELIGERALFLPCWIAKLRMLNIYLRHLSTFSPSKALQAREQKNVDLSVGVIEGAAFLLLEVASQDMGLLSDDQHDLLQDCILFLGLTITTHVSFSQQHHCLPLIIVLRLFNFASPVLISSFSDTLEKAIDLCTPTLFHICATLSVLHKIYYRFVEAPSLLLPLRILIEKILIKHCNLIRNAGIGSPLPTSPRGSYTENTLDTIHIKSEQGSIYFDKDAWQQILVRSEEHPLIICWLSNPSHRFEEMRCVLSTTFIEFRNFIKAELSSFNKKQPQSTVEEIVSNLNSSALKRLSTAQIRWNIYQLTSANALGANSTSPLTASTFLGAFYHPSLYSFYMPFDPKSYFSDYHSMMRHFVAAEYFQFKTPLTRSSNFQPISCRLLYLRERFAGDITLCDNTIYFSERINALPHHRDSIICVTVHMTHFDIVELYYSPGIDCFLLEFFMRNGTSCYFELSDKLSLDFVVNFVCSRWPKIKVCSYLSAISELIKAQMDWNAETLTSFDYLKRLNMLYNRSFHSDFPIVFPKTNQISLEPTIVLPKNYISVFQNIEPMASMLGWQKDVSDSGNNERLFDPCACLHELYAFFQSEELHSLIPSFVDAHFGQIFPNSPDRTSPSVTSSTESGISTQTLVSSKNEMSTSVSTDKWLLDKEFTFDLAKNKTIIDISLVALNEKGLPYYSLVVLTEYFVSRHIIRPNEGTYSFSGFLSYVMGMGSLAKYTITQQYRINLVPGISNIVSKSQFIYTNTLIAQNSACFVALAGFLDNSLAICTPQGALSLLHHHSDLVTSVDIEGEGQLVVSGSRDGVCCFWDLNNQDYRSGSELRRIISNPVLNFYGHTDPIVSIKLNLDSQLVCSCDEGHLFLAHSLKTGLPVYRSDFSLHESSPIFFSTFDFLSIFVLAFFRFDNSTKVKKLSCFGGSVSEITIQHRLTSYAILPEFLLLIFDKRDFEVHIHNHDLSRPIFTHHFEIDIEWIFAFSPPIRLFFFRSQDFQIF